MKTLIDRLWCKLLMLMGILDESKIEEARLPIELREVYDPSNDEHRIMKGEIESFFD